MGSLAKRKLSKKKQRIEEIAKENISMFLKELDAEIPEDGEEIYDNFYYSDRSERMRVVEELKERYRKKEQVKNQLRNLLTEIKSEGNNGFRYLTPQQKYDLNEKRRFEAENIMRDSGLGSEYISELLTPVISEIYKRGKFNDNFKYKVNLRGEIVLNRSL